MGQHHDPLSCSSEAARGQNVTTVSNFIETRIESERKQKEIKERKKKESKQEI